MLRRMKRTRTAALAALGLMIVVAAACASKQNNGEECLKNADCESERCVAHVCVDPVAAQVPSSSDTGVAAESGSDAADSGGGVDAPKDTNPADAADAGPETSDTGAD
jgi:hypothetical protein